MMKVSSTESSQSSAPAQSQADVFEQMLKGVETDQKTQAVVSSRRRSLSRALLPQEIEGQKEKLHFRSLSVNDQARFLKVLQDMRVSPAPHEQPVEEKKQP